jgi:hypothetical protein
MSKLIKCKCPHCGTKIEFAGEDAGRTCDCPSCGNALELPVPAASLISDAPPPQPSNYQQPPQQVIYIKEKAKTGCLTQIIAGLLVLGLIGFIISLVNTPLDSTPTQKGKPTVNAEIEMLSDGVLISNKDSNSWKTVNVYVNSDPPFGYGCRLDDVKPLESKAIPLTEFVKENGERFNPEANKALFLWIGGGDYDYEKFEIQ